MFQKCAPSRQTSPYTPRDCVLLLRSTERLLVRLLMLVKHASLSLVYCMMLCFHSSH